MPQPQPSTSADTQAAARAACTAWLGVAYSRKGERARVEGRHHHRANVRARKGGGWRTPIPASPGMALVSLAGKENKSRHRQQAAHVRVPRFRCTVAVLEIGEGSEGGREGVAGDCHGALSIAAARVHGARADAPILPLPGCPCPCPRPPRVHGLVLNYPHPLF